MTTRTCYVGVRRWAPGACRVIAVVILTTLAAIPGYGGRSSYLKLPPMRKVTAQLGQTLLRQCPVRVIESITEVYRFTEKYRCVYGSRDCGRTRVPRQGPESPWAGREPAGTGPHQP
jgi:hypothetical protein